VAAGGLPVVDVSSSLRGTPVTEAANKFGVAVTKVAAGGMPVVYETIGVAAAIVAAAFDPATVTETALSNGNLTATHTSVNANCGARCSLSYKATGKFYFEVRLITGHGSLDAMGILTSAISYNTLGISAAGCVGLSRSGQIAVNGTNSGKTVGAIAANDIAGMAIDLSARLIWIRRNVGLWNGDAAADPATGTNGLIVPSGSFAPAVCFVGSGTAINDAYTANFGASAFTGTVPSGFTAGWPA
jgi:hypothetical protein